MRLLSSLYAVTFAPAVVAFVAPSIIQPVENCNHQLPQLFTHRQRQHQGIQHFSTSLWAAKPQRLQENVPGVVYVNDRVRIIFYVAYYHLDKQVVVARLCVLVKTSIPTHLNLFLKITMQRRNYSASTAQHAPPLHPQPLTATTSSASTLYTNSPKRKTNWSKPEPLWRLAPWLPFESKPWQNDATGQVLPPKRRPCKRRGPNRTTK